MLGSAEKISEILLMPQKINNFDGEKVEDDRVNGELEVRDVHFTYPMKPGAPVLKGVSFTVSPADKRVVALVGQSGCGKSSIVAMIERFYDPDAGDIFFNGKNIKDLDSRWYHN